MVFVWNEFFVSKTLGTNTEMETSLNISSILRCHTHHVLAHHWTCLQIVCFICTCIFRPKIDCIHIVDCQNIWCWIYLPQTEMHKRTESFQLSVKLSRLQYRCKNVYYRFMSLCNWLRQDRIRWIFFFLHFETIVAHRWKKHVKRVACYTVCK